MPRLYFSGQLGSTSHRERFIDTCQARLSVHKDYFLDARHWLFESHRHPRAKERYIMLDSGAFTAWNQGGRIALSEVVRNYRKLVDRYACYYRAVHVINLDVIPGRRGVRPKCEKIEQAVIESDKNFVILQKEFGDAVLPVFHQHERRERLQEVSKQASFICVSPDNYLHEPKRVIWARRVHAKLKGQPTHGLATTGARMMSTVPWHSVDSASWVKQAGYGGILIQTNKGFKTIKISTRGKEQHYDTAPLHIRRIIEAQAENLDLPIQDLRTKQGAREFFNVSTLSAVSSRLTCEVS